MADGTTSPKFRVWLRPDGIVHLAWQPGAQAGLEDVVASADTVDTLPGGHRHPLWVDARAGGRAVNRASRMALDHREGFLSATLSSR